MPVGLLTDEQATAYGTLTEVLMRSELERFFCLDDVDQDLIALRRTKSHQLGFALQLTTVRYIGLFSGRSAGGAVAGGGVPGRTAPNSGSLVHQAVHRP
ncbi:DUF4158 domain-containing protein [Nonomuraea sp. 3-1Str]|uniref:DUF4158 domain-containing protein n=1 Tax=Nonomuraea sp. 3-1Str TaxID=2929801 RepID=UPI0037CC0CB0